MKKRVCDGEEEEEEDDPFSRENLDLNTYVQEHASLSSWVCELHATGIRSTVWALMGPCPSYCICCVWYCNRYDPYHRGLHVTYAGWDTGKANLYVCTRRVTRWNESGRFRQAREWRQAYVYLILNFPHLRPALEHFRLLGARFTWPPYCLVEVVAKDSSLE